MNTNSQEMAGRKRLPRHQLWLALILGLAFMTPLFKLQAATTFTGCGGEYIAAQNAQAEAQVVELVNAERAKVGLPPYKAVAALTEAARYHAADMAADRYQDHYTYDRDGSDTLVKICNWLERVKKYDPSFDRFTENVGSGTASAQTIMNAWMNSAGHKAAILGDYREIGVGYSNFYWTQDFTTHNSVYPVIINDEARQTTTPAVALYLYGSWTEMRLRNDGGEWDAWQPFQNEVAWTLNNVAGTRTVEVEMRSAQTTVSSSDTIELVLNNQTVTPTPTATATTVTVATGIPSAPATPTVTSTATLTATPTPTEEFVPPTPQAVTPSGKALYLPLISQ